MKRKFLSILLTLAMALTLLPTAAMAEGASYDCEGGTDCHHKVAKINDDPRYDDVVAHFDTLEEAIRLGQMETPPTFKLLDDLTECGGSRREKHLSGSKRPQTYQCQRPHHYG